MNKFLKLYNLIMEELITNKSGNIALLKKDSKEYTESLIDFKSLVNEIVIILQNEFKDQLSKNQTIDFLVNGKDYIIKCPPKIREQIMQKNPFLSEKIESLINNGNLIKDNYIFKINDVSDNIDKSSPFDKIQNDTDDINFQHTSTSSAGEYKIPIIVKSDENEDDFYKLEIKLFAKPNTGAQEKRAGNISITAAEFIPCFLWNINASTSITINEIIEKFINFNFTDSIYFHQNSSKAKIQNLIDYFKSSYQNDNDKKIMDGKLYGAISIYKFMKENFDQYSKNQCIWTDIDALKPAGYENNPGDIMIKKDDKKYISISLKTAKRQGDSPPIKNTTVNAFMQHCNFITNSNDYDIKEKFFYPILNLENAFNDNEKNNLISLIKQNKINKMTSYINNSEISKKCLQIGNIRTFAISKIIEFMKSAFSSEEEILNYFLQVQNEDENFYILKAIEKEGSEPIQVSLQYSIPNKLNIEQINTGFIISGFTINNKERLIKIDVRSKGHGLHAYFGYDLVSILK